MFHARTCIVLVAAATALPGQATWSMLYPPQSPAVRIDAVMAGFEATDEVVLFGGSGMQSVLGDTWILRGDVWTPWTGTAPSARWGAAMAYDRARQRLVLFGGTDQTGYPTSDTWEWNGTLWLQRLGGPAPPPRRLHAMAFDPARGVTVMFAGLDFNPTVLQDLWEWNGTTWSLRAPAGGPVGRQFAGLAFDPVRRVVLLHGGNTTNNTQGIVNDTWSWNGSSWQRERPSTPPPPRWLARMVTDVARQRIVLHGGWGADGSTWEWDGRQWHQRPVVTAGVRASHAMAYDASGRRVVEFGGLVPFPAGSLWMDDTWQYLTPDPATVAAYGSGCAGAAGVPTLANAPDSLPWLGDTFVSRAGNLAATTVVVFFATGLAPTPPQDLTPFGMLGCQRWLTLDAIDVALASAGAASWSLAIPNSAALNGTHLYQQAFAVEPGANAAGVISSNAIDFAVGVR